MHVRHGILCYVYVAHLLCVRSVHLSVRVWGGVVVCGWPGISAKIARDMLAKPIKQTTNAYNVTRATASLSLSLSHDGRNDAPSTEVPDGCVRPQSSTEKYVIKMGCPTYVLRPGRIATPVQLEFRKDKSAWLAK